MRTNLTLTCTLLFLLILTIGRTGMAQEKAWSTKLVASLSVDRDQAYEKEQILLTLKVGIPFNAFNLTQSKLEVPDSEVVSLSKKEFVDVIDDTPYQFEQTSFALFANRAGEITLPRMRFRATLPVASGGANAKRNPEITATTESRTILIKPPPVQATQWLAASDITIEAEWAGDAFAPQATPLLAGEPATRRIYVHVKGQQPAAIPPLPQPQQSQLRSYLDQPEYESTATEQGITGTLTQSTAFVADQPGSITLPELTIKWWDIDDQQWKEASLAAETIDVSPGRSATSTTARNDDSQLREFTYALAALGLVLTAIIAALCLKLKTVSPARHDLGQLTPVLTEAQAWSQLQRDIGTGDLEKIRASLLRWQCALTPASQVTRLDQIGADDDSLRQQLSLIDRTLYRPQRPSNASPPGPHHCEQSVDLKGLRKMLKRSRKAHKDASRLPPAPGELYPIK